MAARQAREEAANLSMFVPGMSSARQSLPPHFDALSPVGRMQPARPLIEELPFDAYESRSSSYGHNRDRSSDRSNNDGRHSRNDYDYSPRDRQSSRKSNISEQGRDDFRSQSQWEEGHYRKKTRYSHS